jgi:Family of unknown function (DUF5302)
MSADASESKPGADDAKPADPDDAKPARPDDAEPDDEVKDRFLDVLKRKQEQSKEKANSGNRGEAKVHEVHRSTKQKRQFRRKSG